MSRPGKLGGTGMSIAVDFLAQNAQQAAVVGAWLADFLAAARTSLDIAIYDWRLAPGSAGPLRQALAARVQAGVRVRVAYDAGKRTVPFQDAGADPAPPGTGDFVAHLGSGIASRRITGGDPRLPKLMHHKYIIRDAGTPQAAVWTGSTNFTDDAWTLQENNIVRIDSPELALYYQTDFEELWQRGDIATTGQRDSGQVQVDGNSIDVAFAPGDGPRIDHAIARLIGEARRRLKLCTMLITSGAILGALGDLVHAGRVPDYAGLYDRTQMESVFRQWHGTPAEWKVAAFQTVAGGLVGKNSTPYAAGTPHDFMHNKVVVADNTVLTGSFNLSHSATENAENVLMIANPELADRYAAYIDSLVSRYRATS